MTNIAADDRERDRRSGCDGRSGASWATRSTPSPTRSVTTSASNGSGCGTRRSARSRPSAQAQLSGTLGVCMGTVGPGSIHLLNGLYDAKKSHAPVLAICGQVPLADLGSDMFQEVDNDLLFRDVACFTRTITSPEHATSLVEQALQAALTEPGRRGADTARRRRRDLELPDGDVAQPRTAVAHSPDPARRRVVWTGRCELIDSRPAR